MAHHLRLKNGKYTVKRRVPVALHRKLGQSWITRSTSTGDYREACRRAPALNAEIERIFAEARADGSQQDATLEWLKGYAADVAKGIKAGEIDVELAEEVFRDHVLSALNKARVPFDETGWPAEGPVLEAVGDAIETVENPDRPPLCSEEFERYLKGLAKRGVRSSVDQFGSKLAKFTDWAGNPRIDQVTRGMAQQYIDDVLLDMGKTIATVSRHISVLHAAFEEAVERDLIVANPFKGKNKALSKKHRKKTTTRPEKRCMTVAEAKRMLCSLERGSDLWNISILAAFTGCRARELAELETKHVHRDRLEIGAGKYRGKNRHSQRIVPLHPAIRKLVANLKRESKDGYLIEGLDSYRGDRWRLASKRYQTAKTKAGFGKQCDFHSWRRTFITRCEVAEIPENVVHRLTGHAQQGMSFGTYSDGPEFKQLAAAIARVDYGKLAELF